jgi:PH (Pleckstrin Homology) domain-containing protein
MGLPAKLLADGERPLVVLRPHLTRLARPAVILIVLAPLASFAVSAVPQGAAQAPSRLVLAALAGMVAARWVVLPFLLWWNTLYVLTDQRFFERQGIVRRSGHDLPLRSVSDVVVAQRFSERLLRSGTLTVTTDSGRDLVITDVPGVVRLQRSLLVVADSVVERARIVYEELWGHAPDALPRERLAEMDDDEALGVAAGQAVDVDEVVEDGEDLDRELAVAASGWDVGGWSDELWDETPAGLSRREARRRDRESARRLKALQAEVRRGPRPDSPLEDDGVDRAREERERLASTEGPDEDADVTFDDSHDDLQGGPDDGSDRAEQQAEAPGARILRFPRRP